MQATNTIFTCYIKNIDKLSQHLTFLITLRISKSHIIIAIEILLSYFALQDYNSCLTV